MVNLKVIYTESSCGKLEGHVSGDDCIIYIERLNDWLLLSFNDPSAHNGKKCMSGYICMYGMTLINKAHYDQYDYISVTLLL